MKCTNCGENKVKFVKNNPLRTSVGVIAGLLFLRPIARNAGNQYLYCKGCRSYLGSFSR